MLKRISDATEDKIKSNKTISILHTPTKMNVGRAPDNKSNAHNIP